MKKRQWILGAAVLLVLLVFILWARHRIHFSFSKFGAELALADWRRIAAAFGCIFIGYFFRAFRWAALMRHNKKVSGLSLAGAQIIGFTAVALIGRVADLVRPYLVARKTETELSSQIAVYIVERLSDMGAIALIFSIAVLQVPQAQVVAAINHHARLASLSHNSPEAAAFLFRYGGLVLTLFGALFLTGIRLGGEVIARIFESVFASSPTTSPTPPAQDPYLPHRTRYHSLFRRLLRSRGSFAFHVGADCHCLFRIHARFHRPARSLAAATPSNGRVLAGGQRRRQRLSTAHPRMVLADRHCRRRHLRLLWRGSRGRHRLRRNHPRGDVLGVVPIGLAWAQLDQVNLRRVTVESEHAGEELSTDSQPLQ